MPERGDPGGDHKIDVLTVAAISVVAFALAKIMHEGIGHGGACVLLGGTPESVSSMTFACDLGGVAGWPRRFLAAGGSLSNLGCAAAFFGLLRRSQRASAQTRYFLWLCGTVNLLQGTGYFLFSGMANVGDWAVFIEGLGPQASWRIVLTVVGAGTYLCSVYWALVQLRPFIGAEGRPRRRRATTLMLVPFGVGAALYIGAGMLHPDGALLLLISAAASSLGGTSGLAWGPQLLRGRRIAGYDGELVRLPRSRVWLTAGVLVTVAFVAVLGPGIQFR